MGTLTSIDNSAFLVTIGNVPLDDIVKLDVPEMLHWAKKDGVRGSLARYRIEGSTNVELTMTVNQWSATNTVLRALTKTDRLTNGGITFSFTAVSLDGSEVIRAPSAYVVGDPDESLAPGEPGDLDWKIQVCNASRYTRPRATDPVDDVAGLLP